MTAFRLTSTSLCMSALSLLLFLSSCAPPSEQRIAGWIADGEFTKAQHAIGNILQNDSTLSPVERMRWEFEIDRMDRIKLDFRKTESDVNTVIAKTMPSVSTGDYPRLEAAHVLEAMVIDGQKRYFNSAASNFFLLDPGARKTWKEQHKNDLPPARLAAEGGLDGHIAQVMEAAVKSGKPYVKPVRVHVTYSITVNGDAVPTGEIIRCWLPFPRDIPGRQEDIRIIAVDPPQYLVADNATYLQRTVYCEKPSAGNGKTKFAVEYEYTSNGVYVPVDPAQVTAPAITPELAPFIREEPPHIVFTPELRKISQEIVGTETNPLIVARRLFAWVDTSVTWASAREYSTVPCLCMYPFENRHGDCGMQTMLFITLCRLNGIPARWQSGWEFRPPDNSMHDWGMIYFAPYGWVPMDVTYGMRETQNEAMRFFYVNGMDSYRLIFNDAFGQPFYPAKIYPRSETVDLQRGEVEWRGGNLYFDKWEWNLAWDVKN